ncbi:MAG: hypothetical protein RLZ98_1275 [Pseudomonadota bacterium]|jgi:ornithine cyclodeaminase/alanine dehydrogenase-like protein (mu-crystallin family)
MAIFLSEADIKALVTINDAIDAVSNVFTVAGEGGVINPPRQQIDIPQGYLRLTSAIVSPLEKIAVKVSSSMVFASDSGRLLLLIDSATGRADALIEVFYLGQLRTAAASGVATRLMARADASTVGVFGSGRQARTQLEAMKAVRPITSALAFSPNRERQQRFCSEMTATLGIPVTPAASPEELHACDILITATTSRTPVVAGGLVRPGTHINAIGANRPERQEIDEETIRRCAAVAVDNKAQAKKESSVLVKSVEGGIIGWEDVVELGDLLAEGMAGGRKDEAITLYNSHGVAMEDVALAKKAYELALAKGIGVSIPLTP